jgi:hypothetical protein
LQRIAAFARDEIAQTKFCRVLIHSLWESPPWATGSISGQLVYVRPKPTTRSK